MTLIVIDGPVASGKSTLARAAVAELERRGRRAVAIDLDDVWASLGGGDAWDEARVRTAELAARRLAEGLDVVIAEGSFPERGGFDGARFVVLRVPFETALARTQADLSRTGSRDPEFLRANHERTRLVAAGDLEIDTSATAIATAAAAIADLAS